MAVDTQRRLLPPLQGPSTLFTVGVPTPHQNVLGSLSPKHIGHSASLFGKVPLKAESVDAIESKGTISLLRGVCVSVNKSARVVGRLEVSITLSYVPLAELGGNNVVPVV